MEYIQTILFQIPAVRLEQASQAGGLLAELDEHRTFLRSQPGFRDLRITRSINNEGNVLVVFESRWSDDSSLVRYETNEPNAASIVRKHADVLVRDSLQVLDMEALRTESSFRAVEASESATGRVVLPVAIPLACLAFILLAIYGLSRIYLEIQGDNAVGLAAGITIGILLVAFYVSMNPRIQGWQIAGFMGVVALVLLGGTIWAVAEKDNAEGEGNGEPTASAAPGSETPTGGPSGGAALVMHDNYFALDGGDHNPDLTVKSGDEITLTNDGAAIHNLSIADASGEFIPCGDPGAVCSDPDTVRAGQTATLTVTLDPGEYKYQCDFHPTEMKGTVTVQ